ncbi:hypothetical protein [Asanoa ferruginea]|uniref:hypothetical protein n=1 Tax=Asanoa ferruginea TaxID=53367 RepID=UPI001476BB28|nr:hypothetical protein [Asanoa ferruginea]
MSLRGTQKYNEVATLCRAPTGAPSAAAGTRGIVSNGRSTSISVRALPNSSRLPRSDA